MADTDRVTLGSALKRMRRERGMTQAQLAAALHWEGIAPIVQIEKDRRIPQSDTLLRIGQALSLPDFDLQYLLGLAGHVARRTMPSQEVILSHLDQMLVKMYGRPYPSYVLDYRFNLWLAMPSCVALLEDWGLDKSTLLEKAEGRLPSIFDIAFNSHFHTMDQIINLIEVQYDLIMVYKLLQLKFRHEPFYQLYPAVMQTTLDERDYTNFETVWNSVNMDDIYKQPDAIFGRPISIYTSKKERWDFSVYLQPIGYLKEFFYLAIWEPLEQTGKQNYSFHLQPTFASKAHPIKIWEHVDINKILAHYND